MPDVVTVMRNHVVSSPVATSTRRSDEWLLAKVDDGLTRSTRTTLATAVIWWLTFAGTVACDWPHRWPRFRLVLLCLLLLAPVDARASNCQQPHGQRNVDGRCRAGAVHRY